MENQKKLDEISRLIALYPDKVAPLFDILADMDRGVSEHEIIAKIKAIADGNTDKRTDMAKKGQRNCNIKPFPSFDVRNV